MVNYNVAHLDTIFSAISHPIRRQILRFLERGPATVLQVAEPFKVSLPAISRHLRLLEEAGLMIRKKKGREHHCHLNAKPLQEAAEWITHYEQFWGSQLDALEEFLDETKNI
ncbi:MAG: metalloregulator ArsR/SmtB family transcription factor [Chloroflexota bacterium]